MELIKVYESATDLQLWITIQMFIVSVIGCVELIVCAFDQKRRTNIVIGALSFVFLIGGLSVAFAIPNQIVYKYYINEPEMVVEMLDDYRINYTDSAYNVYELVKK